jgi:hypothetical protein
MRSQLEGEDFRQMLMPSDRGDLLRRELAKP